MSYEEDQDRLLRLLEEVENDSEASEENESELQAETNSDLEPEEINESAHDTDSTEDGDEDGDETQEEWFYLGKTNPSNGIRHHLENKFAPELITL